MDRILILDNDAAHADALVRALRRTDRSIETCANTRLTIAKCLTDATDVLIVVPASPRDWKEQLSTACATLKSSADHPAVLCVLRWTPQGPMDRLFGDALGIEVQYER
jgi:anthranilate/para-aminobenzoate synthase component II